MGSISCHSMPLVITSFGDGHTDTHTHTLTYTHLHTHTLRQDQFLNQAHAGYRFKNSKRNKQTWTGSLLIYTITLYIAKKLYIYLIF